MKRIVLVPLLGALVQLGAVPAATEGQIPWEAPRLAAPGAPAGLGLHVTRYGYGIGYGAGGVLTYRTAAHPGGFGLRVAVAEGQGSSVAFAGGVELGGSLVAASRGFPLDLSWAAGLGGGHDRYAAVAAPLGVVAGRVLDGGAWQIVPYVGGGLVLEMALGDGAPSGGVDVGVAIDVGIDLSRRESPFALRAAMSFGDRPAVALGAAVRARRGGR